MALNNSNPTTTNAWQKLSQHFAENQHIELKELFKNASRKEDFSIEVERLNVDFSKNRITATHIASPSDPV